MSCFLETQERVRNSRGKRTISVRAIEVLLYIPGDHLHTDITTCHTEEAQQKYCLGMVSNNLLGGGGGA